MNTTIILHQLIDIGMQMGAVDCVHMYDTDFLAVEGRTDVGKKFSITLRLEEEEKNAEELE